MTTNRSAIRLIALLIVMMAVSACDQLPGQGPVKATPTSTPQSPLATPPAAPDTCENPVPPGESALINDLELMVNAVVLPADLLVATGDPANPTPRPDHQFILVSLSIICRRSAGDCQLPSATDFCLRGSAPTPLLPLINVAGVPALLGPGTISPGSTVYGGLIFEIPTGQQNLLLTYQGDTGSIEGCFVVRHWVSVAEQTPTPLPEPTRTPRPTRTPTPTPTPPASPLPTPTPVTLLPPSGDGIEWPLVLSGAGGMLILIGWLWHQLKSRRRDRAQQA